MPIWSQILNEILDTSHENDYGFHDVRRKYLALLNKHTGRSVILYASGWLQNDSNLALGSINDIDVQAFMEVSYGLGGTDLDLILHSPGGSIGAAEAIVSYLRSRFEHIRIIVPNLAMSAAAMISCAADELVLGEHSFLGPTDPQIPIRTVNGIEFVPVQAILDEFERAKLECRSRGNRFGWHPILTQYRPGLLQESVSAQQMSTELVSKWLNTYMLNDQSNKDIKSRNESEIKSVEISEKLSDNTYFKMHDRRVSRSTLVDWGLNIQCLENDQELQDLCLSVFHATTLMFETLDINKVVENHTGHVFIK